MKKKISTLLAASMFILAGSSLGHTGTIPADTMQEVQSNAKKLGFPIITGTVVYCVQPDTGIVDMIYVVNSSQDVSCPGDDTFLIEKKFTKFIAVTQ